MNIILKSFRQTINKIISIILIDLLLSIVFTIFYFFSTTIEKTIPLFVFFVSLFIIYYILLFILFYIFYLVDNLTFKYKKFGITILIVIILFLTYYGYLFITNIAIEIYPVDNTTSDSDKINSFFQFLSILIAIVIPLYLTEVNRKDSRKIIEENKTESRKQMAEERLSYAMPVFKFSIGEVLQDNYLDSDYLAFLNDEPNGNEVVIPIKFTNISDRIIRNIKPNKVKARYVNPLTKAEYNKEDCLYNEQNKYSISNDSFTLHDVKLGILSFPDDSILEKGDCKDYYIGYSVWDEKLERILENNNLYVYIFVEIEFEITDIYSNIYSQTYRFVVMDRNLNPDIFSIDKCWVGNLSKSILSIIKYSNIETDVIFDYEKEMSIEDLI